uniref:Dehydrogenase/reductase SDR family member 2 n=1 Tax=Arundo donax TaxID=35708 RepID=A0A0A9E5A8_ARUDO
MPSTEGFAAAFETSISMCPKFLTAVSMRCLRCWASETWQTAPTAVIPLALSPSTASFTFFCLREEMTTAAPSRPRRSAMARPIPCVDAVTTAPFPSSRRHLTSIAGRASSSPLCRLLLVR